MQPRLASATSAFFFNIPQCNCKLKANAVQDVTGHSPTQLTWQTTNHVLQKHFSFACSLPLFTSCCSLLLSLLWFGKSSHQQNSRQPSASRRRGTTSFQPRCLSVGCFANFPQPLRRGNTHGLDWSDRLAVKTDLPHGWRMSWDLNFYFMAIFEMAKLNILKIFHKHLQQCQQTSFLLFLAILLISTPLQHRNISYNTTNCDLKQSWSLQKQKSQTLG